MTQLLRGDIRQEQGAAPSSVSMAVLWVEGFGLLLAMPLFGGVPEVRSVFVLPLALLALLFTETLAEGPGVHAGDECVSGLL
ncbi:hypothetical protein [Streptomyces sp. NPDC018000]|uniref:hypothetical protein n=1 Tax=Streptomyces sp. NPDC018000 TaxID=3365028 RepID=UPI00379637AF